MVVGQGKEGKVPQGVGVGREGGVGNGGVWASGIKVAVSMCVVCGGPQQEHGNTEGTQRRIGNRQRTQAM